jgi:hypothetical protein
VLIIQLFFKFFIKKCIVFKIVSINFNSKFNYYLNKITILNNKIISILIILLLIELSIFDYVSKKLYNNIDDYIYVHNYLKNK